MKKQLLSAVALLGLGMSSLHAQFNYNFSVQTQAYATLTGTSNISGSTIWDDEDFQQTIGFNFNINGTPVTTANLMGSLGASMLSTSVSSSTISAFMYTDADLWDRSNASNVSTPTSPISYVVTGATPNRIMKIEIYNAGFFEESTYSTNNDYANIQIWLYETTNVIEFHYGPSAISHASDYFTQVPGKPFFGFFQDLNLNAGTVTKAYFLKGSSSTPTLDSATTLAGITDALTTYPTNSTVYRFTPKTNAPTGIASLTDLTSVAVYPTVTQNELMVSNNEKEPLTYTILALNGTTVDMNGTLSTGNNTLNVSALASGVYVIDLHTAAAAKRVKFIKQ